MFATSNKLFACPRCRELTLSAHKKTYEAAVIFFCSNCRLTSVLEPSKEAQFDMEKAWKEFTSQYKQNPLTKKH